MAAETNGGVNKLLYMIITALAVALMSVGGWAWNSLSNEDEQQREDIRIVEGKLDFYSHTLGELNATSARLDERTKAMEQNLKDIKAALTRRNDAAGH